LIFPNENNTKETLLLKPIAGYKTTQ